MFLVSGFWRLETELLLGVAPTKEMVLITRHIGTSRCSQRCCKSPSSVIFLSSLAASNESTSSNYIIQDGYERYVHAYDDVNVF